MATLIPALGSCVSRMTSGERRVAERLEQKLDTDYLLWYDVAVGPRHSRPGTTRTRSSTRWSATRSWCRAPGPHQAQAGLSVELRRGASPTSRASSSMPPNCTHAIEPHRVHLPGRDAGGVEPEDLQSRLWDMFPYMMRGVLTLPQIDRVRWIMFPEVRVRRAAGLFDDTGDAAAEPQHHARDGPAAGAAGAQPGRRPPRHPRRGRLGQDHDPGLPRRAPGPRRQPRASPCCSFATTNRWP
jgi:hypothetical protein